MARSLLNRLAALEQSVNRTSPATVEQGMTSLVSQRNEANSPAQANNDLTAQLGRLGFHQEDDGHGPLYVSRVAYDLLTWHGTHRFIDAVECDRASLEKATKATLNVDELRFYDTETTGLGTGAGTFVFLHTVGAIEDDELVLYQYFVAQYSQEYAVLQRIWTKHLSGKVTLVTFNGKSYDLPLLKNRMILYRIPFNTEYLSHADLLYPARRLWKNRLESVSLGTLERELLGLVRIDDLPGKEAPSRYFQFTDSLEVNLVEPVFKHNASDVCSLVTLLAHICDIMNGAVELHSSAELLALARWYDEWQEFELADACFVRATEQADADYRTYLQTSMYCKKNRKYQEACLLWETMTEKFPYSVVPLVELAKVAEHHIKDYRTAEKWALLALERTLYGIGRMTQAGRGGESPGIGDSANTSPLSQLRHRLDRIRRKLQTHGNEIDDSAQNVSANTKK